LFRENQRKLRKTEEERREKLRKKKGENKEKIYGLPFIQFFTLTVDHNPFVELIVVVFPLYHGMIWFGINAFFFCLCGAAAGGRGGDNILPNFLPAFVAARYVPLSVPPNL
jgi:hypothetical protein